MRVEVIRAWPHRFESVALDLPEGATVREALAACPGSGVSMQQQPDVEMPDCET